jgi:Ca2+-binding EF-hand superfamily protein
MPPKELPKVVRGPSDILSHLNEGEKLFLRCFLSLLHEDTTIKLRKLFDVIDDNKDGRINCMDFKHHHKEVAKYLKQMWEYFKKRFDFNEDDLISFDEFKQGLPSVSQLI